MSVFDSMGKIKIKEKSINQKYLRQVSNSTRDYIKRVAPSKTGYFKAKMEDSYSAQEKAWLIYNGGGTFRLTHLLNNGHFVVYVNRKGQKKRTHVMTKAYHFMDKGEKHAEQELDRLINHADINDLFDLDTRKEVIK